MNQVLKAIIIIGLVVGAGLLIVEGYKNYQFQQSEESGNDIDLYQELQAGDESGLETVLLAGGCFWCVEADLEKVPGVVAVVSGYAGGSSINPTYKDYAAGGHREVVEVVYDADKVSYAELVEYLVKHVDPTDQEGSFVDRGVQYTPAIYFKNPAQQAEAIAVISKIEDLGVYKDSLNIPALPDATFYPAEDYHQDFYKKSVVRYQAYRAGSGRDAFVKRYWGN